MKAQIVVDLNATWAQNFFNGNTETTGSKELEEYLKNWLSTNLGFRGTIEKVKVTK